MIQIKPITRSEYGNREFAYRFTTTGYYDIERSATGLRLIHKPLPEPEEVCDPAFMLESWLPEPDAYGAFEDDRLIGFVEGYLEKMERTLLDHQSTHTGHAKARHRNRHGAHGKNSDRRLSVRRAHDRARNAKQQRERHCLLSQERLHANRPRPLLLQQRRPRKAQRPPAAGEVAALTLDILNSDCKQLNITYPMFFCNAIPIPSLIQITVQSI